MVRTNTPADDLSIVRQQPLTPSQIAILAGQEKSSGIALYNMAMAIHLPVDIDPNRFSHAWQQTCSEHDALRIRLHSNEPKQFLSDFAEPLQVLDFQGEHSPLIAAKQWMKDQAEKPFELDSCLINVALLRVGETKWVFFCCQHHLITDATSFPLVLSTLDRFYHETRAAPVSQTVPSFMRYVAKRHIQSNSSSAAACRTYWSAKACPPPLRLYGRSQSEVLTGSIRCSEVVEKSKLDRLKYLLHANKPVPVSASLKYSQLLLTLVFAYCYRVTGQPSLAVSLPVPVRNARYKHCAGLFLEVLPVVVEIDNAETFESLYEKVQRAVGEVYKNTMDGASQWVSGHKPSVVFNYINATFGEFAGKPVLADWIHSGHSDAHHILRFQITRWNNEETPDIAIDFNLELFNEEERVSAVRHLNAVVDSMLSGMDKQLDSFEITAGQSVATEVLEQNTEYTTKASLPVGNACVLDLFSNIVKTRSEQTAIVDGDCVLSYQQLDNHISALASAMKLAGTGPGSRVGVLLPRSACIPVAYMAILKTGAAFVPIEASTPVDRIVHLLDDGGITSVVTLESTIEKVAGIPGIQLWQLGTNGALQSTAALMADDFAGDISSEKDAKENAAASKPSDDLKAKSETAYILYTSGSTGLPKGVVISKSALRNYCTWAIDYYTNGESLVFPLFTPIGFDLTITSIFVPLLSGGQIRVYAPESELLDNSLSRVVDDNCVDIIKLTPAHLATLQTRDLRHSRVRQLIVGGEDLKCTLAQKIYQCFDSRVIIHNEYGPTEATVGCIVHKFDAAIDTTGSVPIGSPVAGMNAWVMNAQLQLQVPGVAGELFLSGPSLADGYWKQAETTRRAFLQGTGSITERLYRTGDLARVNRQGRMVYLGREDSQVKVRGARIEMAEIESAALSHPSVSGCVARIIEANDGRKHEEETHCVRCSLSSRYPQATLNNDGVCSLCEAYEQYQERAGKYFKSFKELETLARQVQRTDGGFDCMMLLSGGKDSTYALARLVDMGLRVLAFTLENGYLSKEAKINITKVCDALGVEHEFGQTPAMADIFADSLRRFSNVCNGCFKTIYTLGMKRAFQLDIPVIFTGLSRGQFFETRLNEELFTSGDLDVAGIDKLVLSARKAYHRSDDAVSQLLDTRVFSDDEIFEAVKIVDFYRYCPVELDDMMEYLQTRLPWQRPRDTGRSTNCLINDVGIYVHKVERGYHNYSLPYSWDVRLGHKQRDAALEELDDKIDVHNVQKILAEIDYEIADSAPSAGPRIALYYTSDDSLSSRALSDHLQRKLPTWMLPSWLMPLTELPLNVNGKIDRSLLPAPSNTRMVEDTEYIAPKTQLQREMAHIWSEELQIESVGISDNYFAIGGDSLSAIRIIASINSRGYDYKITDIFEHQTIDDLCADSTGRKASTTRTEQQPTAAFSSLNSGQLSKLEQVLKRD